MCCCVCGGAGEEPAHTECTVLTGHEPVWQARPPRGSYRKKVPSRGTSLGHTLCLFHLLTEATRKSLHAEPYFLMFGREK